MLLLLLLPCRRCKSFEELQKHFRQLHEREHKKKLGGPRKSVKKYVQSDKAARVRWVTGILFALTGWFFGTGIYQHSC